MKVHLGPVPPTSADAWIGWAREMIAEMRRQPESAVTLAGQVLDDVSLYVDAWAGANCRGDVFSWLVDVDPDELEYLTNAFFNLDTRLSAEVGRGERQAEPADGRTFHLVLVRGLLTALAAESPAQAAFAERLRSFWPTAAQAC